jgi:hypothetical protein
MFRKLMLALGATVALAGAALTPTTASAWHPHGHHHHWHGKYWGFYGPAYYVGGGGCYTVKKVVYTPWGPRKRLVTICD